MFKTVVILSRSVLLFSLLCLGFDTAGVNRASAAVNSEWGKAGACAAASSQFYLPAMKRRSAEMLARHGDLLAAYAADHDGRYPSDPLRDLGPYYVPKDSRRDRPLGHFILHSVEYLAAGKARKDLPKTAAVTYDKILLSMTDGTNVLFADGRMEFVKQRRLKTLGIEPGQKLTMAKPNQAYEVTLPEQWKPYVSAGKLTVVGAPFYGVRSKLFPVWPHVRIRWSLKNLTSQPVEVAVQYKSWRTSRLGGTPGFGGAYRLAPNEYRAIDEITHVVTATEPMEFYVVSMGLRHNGQEVDALRWQRIVTTDPLRPGKLPPSKAESNGNKTAQFAVKQSRLRYAASQGNLLELDVSNRTGTELPLLAYAAAGDPGISGADAYFFETTQRLAAHGQSVVRLPYSVPVSGPNPLLVFTVFEPLRGSPPADGRLTYRDVTPLYWGWFDLGQAAEQGLAKVPAYLPLEERTKLTAEKRSEHFLFRFRPDSFAQRNIDRAIEQREQAYRRLSKVLAMELPETVTIDLYTDMQAKGLGSGTHSTPANTVTNTHIAEVYNSNYQCNVYHELAHIFSYHFGEGGPAAPGLREDFAEYFEHHNVNLDEKRQAVRRRLNDGKLRPLHELLLSGSTCPEHLLIIDFLLKCDSERFKAFYVRVTHAKDAAGLENASREVYGAGLKDVEKQWHQCLAAADKASTPEKPGDGGKGSNRKDAPWGTSRITEARPRRQDRLIFLQQRRMSCSKDSWFSAEACCWSSCLLPRLRARRTPPAPACRPGPRPSVLEKGSRTMTRKSLLKSWTSSSTRYIRARMPSV